MTVHGKEMFVDKIISSSGLAVLLAVLELQCDVSVVSPCTMHTSLRGFKMIFKSVSCLF